MASKTKALLDFIGNAEAKGNYNAIYGKADSSKPLDQMTVAEILKFQKEHGDKTGSSAIGRYQFLEGTLKTLVRDNKISKSAKFTPELQDQLATDLLERRGLNKYLSGKITAEQFGNRLSREWAALPQLTGANAGKSYYAGVGDNNARVSADDFLGALNGTGGQLTGVASELSTTPYDAPTPRQRPSALAGYFKVPMPRPRPGAANGSTPYMPPDMRPVSEEATRAEQRRVPTATLPGQTSRPSGIIKTRTQTILPDGRVKDGTPATAGFEPLPRGVTPNLGPLPAAPRPAVFDGSPYSSGYDPLPFDFTTGPRTFDHSPFMPQVATELTNRSVRTIPIDANGYPIAAPKVEPGMLGRGSGVKTPYGVDDPMSMYYSPNRPRAGLSASPAAAAPDPAWSFNPFRSNPIPTANYVDTPNSPGVDPNKSQEQLSETKYRTVYKDNPAYAAWIAKNPWTADDANDYSRYYNPGGVETYKPPAGLAPAKQIAVREAYTVKAQPATIKPPAIKPLTSFKPKITKKPIRRFEGTITEKNLSGGNGSIFSENTVLPQSMNNSRWRTGY